MAKKLETVMLIASLEKAAKKTEKAFWSDLSERLEGRHRNKVAVNLDKLNEMAAKNRGKILVVPGKVLSNGELSEKATIVGVAASEEAKAKIKSKGEFITLKEFAAKADKIKVSDVIIVK